MQTEKSEENYFWHGQKCFSDNSKKGEKLRIGVQFIKFDVVEFKKKTFGSRITQHNCFGEIWHHWCSWSIHAVVWHKIE